MNDMKMLGLTLGLLAVPGRNARGYMACRRDNEGAEPMCLHDVKDCRMAAVAGKMNVDND